MRVNAPSFDVFLNRLRQAFPDYPVITVPFRSPEDEVIQRFVHLLGVPIHLLHDVASSAWDLAFDVYGDEPIDLLMTTIDPATAREAFAEEWAAEQARRAVT